jgi:hypothetical protein
LDTNAPRSLQFFRNGLLLNTRTAGRLTPRRVAPAAFDSAPGNSTQVLHIGGSGIDPYEAVQRKCSK